MSQATAAALTSIATSSKAVAIISGNVANIDTNGYKAFHPAYSDLVSSHGDLSQGVTATSILKVDQQGTFRRTDIATDLAIGGNGFFVVTDSSLSSKNADKIDAVLFTKDGSFRKNKDGYLEDTSGHILLARKLDVSDVLPADKSTVQNLAKVNIQGLFSEASPTTEVDVVLNFGSLQKIGGGSNATMSINTQSPDNASINSDQILYPNQHNSLIPGNGIKLELPDESINMIYGGFVQSSEFENTEKGLISFDPSDGFEIRVGVESKTTSQSITKPSGTNNIEVLQDIVNQLNSTIGEHAITARLVSKGNKSSILVAPKNSSLAMKFPENSAFGKKLGFTADKGIEEAKGVNRFASFKNLEDILNNNKKKGIEATASKSGSATLTINSQHSIKISNYNPNKQQESDFLKEFSMREGYLPTLYNPYDSNHNMAGGKVKGHLEHVFQVYDSIGNTHSFLISFLKVGGNQWATEIYASDKTAVNVRGRSDGLLQAGYLTFDSEGKYKADLMAVQGDLSLKNTHADSQLTPLSDTMVVNWSSDVNTKPSEIKLNFGNKGNKGDIRQDVAIRQNGSSFGELTNVQVDSEGYIIANFSNTKSRKIYKIPIADFANPNGLTPVSGNAFAASKDSGTINLKDSGQEGAGKIIPGSIEGSNVDVSEELSKLMQVQRRFQASAKVINIEDKMHEELLHRTYA